MPRAASTKMADDDRVDKSKLIKLKSLLWVTVAQARAVS